MEVALVLSCYHISFFGNMEGQTCGGNQAADIWIGADMAIGPAIMFMKEPGEGKHYP